MFILNYLLLYYNKFYMIFIRKPFICRQFMHTLRTHIQFFLQLMHLQKILYAILEREDANDRSHPIDYVSNELRYREKNNSTTKVEISNVVFVVNYFKQKIFLKNVIIFGNHSSLQYYKTMKTSSSRTTKYIFILLQFNVHQTSFSIQ